MKNKLFLIMMTALLMFACAVRILNLIEISKSEHEFTSKVDSDPYFFYHWSLKLKQDDLLFEQALHTVNYWHRWSVKKYLPEATEDEVRAIWYKWYGEKTYHQAPGYPYLLAFLFRLSNDEIISIYAFQSFLGILTLILLILIARDLFDDLTALIAAVLYIFYGPVLYFEATILRASLLTFLNILLIYSLIRTIKSPKSINWFAVGSVVGVLIVVKASNVLIAAAIPLGIFFTNYRNSNIVKPTIAMLSGVAICLLPIFVRNYIVGASLFSISSTGPVTFLISNHASMIPATGWRFTPDDIYEIMLKTNGKMLAVMWETLATHPDFFSIFKLYLGKFLCFWHPDEISSQLYLDSNKFVNRVSFVTFTQIIGFSWIGMIVSRDKLKQHWPLFLILLVTYIICIAFYNLSRFRLPIMPILFIYSAFGIQLIIHLLGRKKYIQAVKYLLIVIVISFFCHNLYTFYPTQFFLEGL